MERDGDDGGDGRPEPAMNGRRDPARERDAFFRAAFGMTDVCMAISDPEGCVLEVNDAMLRFFSVRSAPQLEGRALRDLPGLESPDALDHLLKAAQAGHRASGELVVQYRETRRIMSATLAPILEGCGEARDGAPPDDARVTSILFEGVDVTAARERERLEHLMTLVGQTASVGGFTVRAGADEVRLHPSSRELLGVGPSVYGRDGFSQLFGEPELVVAGLDEVLIGPDQHWTREMPLGPDRWVRLYLSSHARADGRVWAVGAVQDITRARREEAELRHAQRLDALGRLAGGVAHDFNNLLTAIMGSAELLQENLPVSEHPLIEEISLAANLGKAMTQRLLTVARKQPVHPVTMDLAKHLAEAAPLWRRMVGEQVELQISTTRPQCWVRFDPRLLDQVIMNLILNARDAMPGGGRVEIQLEEAERDGADDGAADPRWFRIVVIDQGRGMSTDTLARALEPFFTTKGGEGTGLGLSTSHAILRQGGGDLKLDSHEGVGTRAIIWLPRHRPRPESLPGPAPRASNVEPVEVLLVEDDARVRRVVARMLRRCGHRVRQAEGADDAERLLREGGVDLIMSDVVMPGMSGPALIERLRALQPDLPVLFMSGYPGGEMERLGMSVRDPFLPKPFSIADLEAKLQEILGGA